MANEEHLGILVQGVEAWNRWRNEYPKIKPDLRGEDLREIDLVGANLNGTDLVGVDLSKVNLSKTTFVWADLASAYLGGAVLCGTDLTYADLSWADFRDANLSGANLELAKMVKTKLQGAIISDCRVYGISAWDLELKGAIQKNLIITRENAPIITVDNLEVAQFIYLLLNNERIREVINATTTKLVLILGRFTRERKAVLNAITEELRKSGRYIPVLFDFEAPATRNTHETIMTLAYLSRFVIADITDAKSIIEELDSIVPNLTSLPIQPLLQAGFEPWGMYEHYEPYPWVMDIYRYENLEDLIASLEAKVVAPAEAKAEELTTKRLDKRRER